jgi:hypothetical protein
MAKVSIRTHEQARPAALPDGFTGVAACKEYFRTRENTLQLHAFELQGLGSLIFERCEADRVAYIWRGAVIVGGHRLAKGSSFIVEHGRELEAHGLEERCTALVFAPNQPTHRSLAGGHVHLLPTESVPRSSDLGGASGVGGGMHADSSCPTCEVWLHENSFPGSPEDASIDAEAGIHSHTEDEIIFVTDGDMRLGSKLYGSGTALAIAASTFYGFTAGPNGLKFVNFRASAPGAIAFRSRASMDERSYWSSRLSRPVYINL